MTDLRTIGQNIGTTIQPYLHNVQKFCVDNAPTLLAVGGILGNGATLITSAMAGAKSQRMIFEEEIKLGRNLTKEEKFKLCWKNYIIPFVCFGLGSACTWQSNREATARLMAANALANLTADKLKKLEDKVDSELPKDKSDKVKNALDKDGIREALDANAIEHTGHGNTIFKDVTMGGFFYSETWFVREAINKINAELTTGFGEEQLNEFYSLLGREPIACGYHLGWEGMEHSLKADIDYLEGSPDEFGRPVMKLKYNIYTIHCAQGKDMT